MMEPCWALLLPPHPPRWAPIAPGAEIVSGMAKSTGRSRRVSNGLVGLGSAAVLTIYGAGYLRTRPAAARIALAAERRPVAAPYEMPAPSSSGEPAAVRSELSAAPPSAAASAPATASPAVTPPLSAPAPDASPIVPKSRSARAVRSATAKSATGVDRVAVGRPASSQPAASARSVEAPPAEHLAAPSASAELPPVAAVTPDPVTAPAAASPAPAAPAAAPTATTAAAPHWKDGTYLGWGSSRHGDIQASVEIRDGRIVSATIAQCLTRYSCSWIAALPPQVAARQSPETDYVSGATQSTNAFYYAVVEALSKAK